MGETVLLPPAILMRSGSQSPSIELSLRHWPGNISLLDQVEGGLVTRSDIKR